MKKPSVKAKQLIGRYFRTGHNIDYDIEMQYAKLNALICIDEILKENERINLGGAFPTPLTAWWKKVRKEILQNKV